MAVPWIVRHEKSVLRCLAVAAFFTLVFAVFSPSTLDLQDAHYLWLADSFLRGRLDLPAAFVEAVGRMDTVLRGGDFYWPLGPLPALLFMPAVAAIGPEMIIESYGHAILAFAAFAAAFALARRKGFAAVDAAWLAAAFGLGSVVVGLLFMNGPWHFENLLSCVLLLAALVEREGKRRPWLIGSLAALAAASRLPSLLISGFFFLDELAAARPRAGKVRRFASMAAPVLAMLLALGAYNAARFGSPFATGQSDHQLLVNDYSLGRDRDGVFNVVNVPRNFAIYFFEPPSLIGGIPAVEPRGLSLLLISPAFLWLLFAPWRKAETMHAAFCAALLLALLLAYFTDGSSQFGPRYLADAAPLAFLLLLGVFRERGFGAAPKAVIAASAALNLGLFWTYLLHAYYKVY